MIQKYWLDPLNSVELLASVLMELAAPSVRVAVEGDRHLLDLVHVPGAVIGPLDPFKVNGRNMIVVPLKTQEDVHFLTQRLTTGHRLSPELDAVQIERNGHVEFMAADGFHRECISVGPSLPDSFWESLVRKGTIRGFYSPGEAADHFGLPRRDA